MRNFERVALTRTVRRLVLTLGVGVLAGTLLSTQAQAQAAPIRNKIVLQVSDNDPGKWGLALNNAQNAQSELGAGAVDLEIVVYGPGIGMLKGDSPVAARIGGALKSGVKVVACESTLKAQKLTYADMLPNIGYVPAGVVELMQKQQQGYAYVRP